MKVSLKVLNSTPGAIYRCEDHPDRCDTCLLNVKNGGRCLTCSAEKLASCGQNSCGLGCNTCGGFRVKVPAVCCKSPTAHTFLIQASGNGNFQQPVYSFTRRESIYPASRAILIARGGGLKMSKGTPYLEESDVVAISLKEVWSGGRGFFSKDLKDLMRLPSSKKLLLITAQLDDWLEKVWDKEFFGGEDFEAHGIDYWMPPAFSLYINDGHMNRYWQMLRTLLAIQNGKAHFVPLPRAVNLKVDDLYLDALDKIPHGIFNCQFSSKFDILKLTLATIKYWHERANKDVSFWMIGPSNPKFFHNVKRVLGSRKTYFLSSNPFRLANHGKELLEDGRAKKLSALVTTKEELVFKNQRTFIDMVQKYA